MKAEKINIKPLMTTIIFLLFGLFILDFNIKQALAFISINFAILISDNILIK